MFLKIISILALITTVIGRNETEQHVSKDTTLITNVTQRRIELKEPLGPIIPSVAVRTGFPPGKQGAIPNATDKPSPPGDFVFPTEDYSDNGDDDDKISGTAIGSILG